MKKTSIAPSELTSSFSLPRQKAIKEMLEGKVVTVFMAMVTLWVLIGDDLRLIAFSASSDEGFFISFTICLILFTAELILNSLFVEDYKFSFFFWLDVVATLSLIPDIPYIFDPFLGLFAVEFYQTDVTVHTPAVRDTRLEDYTDRVVNSIRFIRLVRIVKLYKYFSRSRTEEDIKESPEDTDPRSLGKHLSDVTTRRVIIGVLLMLLLLPMLQVQRIDNSQYYGLQQLFWAGIGCTNNTFTDCSEYLTPDGWANMIDLYSKSSIATNEDSPVFPLLWLRAPAHADGKITDIQAAGSWTSDIECSGKSISSDCSLRESEMKLMVYSPKDCIDGDQACEELQVYSRFNIQEYVRNNAALNLITTVFVGIILAASSMLFARDTQKIVVEPVNKMVKIVKALAEEPLKEDDTQAPGDSILEETFEKIGTLLYQSFGFRGAEIMNPVLTDPALNIMKTGHRRDAVIAVCTIQNFPAIVDCLQEELLVFTNKIAQIVHVCSRRWGGIPCRNEMGVFMTVWPEHHPSRALLAMIKIQAEISRAVDILAYHSNNKIVTKFGDGYQLNLNMALHAGWIVEGPIGSSYKMDPGYISHHFDIAESLSDATEEFGVPLLMSADFYNMIGPKAQSMCRLVDCLLFKSQEKAISVYTFDMIDEVPLPSSLANEPRLLGDPIITGEAAELSIDDYYRVDNDVDMMQRNIPEQFRPAFALAMEAYFSGDWSAALLYFEDSLTLKPGDGPSIALKKLIEKEYAGKAPESWNGFRSISHNLLIS